MGEFIKVEDKIISSVGDDTNTCIKEILLSDDNSQDFFKLNEEKLIRKDGEEDKSPIWESYLEYDLDLKSVLL